MGGTANDRHGVGMRSARWYASATWQFGSRIMRGFLGGIAVALALGFFAAPSIAADDAERQHHHLAIHVDQNEAAVMNMALNNASHVIEYYHEKGEDVQVEIVAYGPGLNMLREDTSPVKDRIKALKEVSFPKNLKLSACNNTKVGMEKREGHAITIIPEASLVPSGVVRLMELQEQGWSYVRP
jgi:intracellular sulfur oxidation DsrE/DsrF family protein